MTPRSTRVVMGAQGALYVLHGEEGLIAKVTRKAFTTAPVVRTNGVVNAATLPGPTLPAPSGIAPGTIVSIHGENLAGETRASGPRPISALLPDTAVTFNDIPALLYLVSPSEIRAVVPYDLPLGPAQIRVRREAEVSNAVTVEIAEATPGIFTITHADGSRLVTAEDPTRPGEIVTAFSTGLGRLREPATSSEGEEVRLAPKVRLYYHTGASEARVTFVGNSPDTPGLYQISFEVPPDAASLSRVRLVVNEQFSNEVILNVRP